MINRENLQKAGKILKAHGIGGEMTVAVNLDLFEKSEEMESMFIEIDGYLVPFFFEEIREKTENHLIIKFDGVDSDKMANRFRSCEIYIDKKFAGNNSDLINYSDLRNYKLVDQLNNQRGTITDYYHIHKNPVLVISYKSKEYYIPANEELIISIDYNNKRITVNLTEGIFDL